VDPVSDRCHHAEVGCIADVSESFTVYVHRPVNQQQEPLHFEYGGSEDL
jgi:hypothetical protein